MSREKSLSATWPDAPPRSDVTTNCKTPHRNNPIPWPKVKKMPRPAPCPTKFSQPHQTSLPNGRSVLRANSKDLEVILVLNIE